MFVRAAAIALALALGLGKYAGAPSYTVAVFGPECIRDIEKTPFTHAEAPYTAATGVDMSRVHVYGLTAKVRESCAKLEVRHK